MAGPSEQTEQFTEAGGSESGGCTALMSTSVSQLIRGSYSCMSLAACQADLAGAAGGCKTPLSSMLGKKAQGCMNSERMPSHHTGSVCRSGIKSATPASTKESTAEIGTEQKARESLGRW